MERSEEKKHLEELYKEFKTKGDVYREAARSYDEDIEDLQRRLEYYVKEQDSYMELARDCYDKAAACLNASASL